MSILHGGKASQGALGGDPKKASWARERCHKEETDTLLKLRRRRKRSGTRQTQTLARSSASGTSPQRARVDATLAPWQYKYLPFHFCSHQPSKGTGPVAGPQAHKGDFQGHPQMTGDLEADRDGRCRKRSPPLLLAAWGEAAPKHDLLQLSYGHQASKDCGQRSTSCCSRRPSSYKTGCTPTVSQGLAD